MSIQADYQGEPMQGYQVGMVTTNPEKVSVVGDKEALQQLEEEGNVIKIPADYIDISNADKDITEEVDLSQLMPDNMRISANTASTAEVIVTILPEGSREFTIDVDDITPQSMRDDLSVSYDQTEVTVILRGNDEMLEKLNAADLKPMINCSEMTEGDYEAPLNLSLPEGVEMVDSVKITVHLKQAPRTG